MRSRFAAVALIGILVLAGCSADVGPPAGLSHSAGSESCRDFLAHSGPEAMSDLAANQWVMGYFTGRVEAAPDAPHSRFGGSRGIMAEVARYCRDNIDFPGLDIDTAAMRVFEP